MKSMPEFKLRVAKTSPSSGFALPLTDNSRRVLVSFQFRDLDSKRVLVEANEKKQCLLLITNTKIKNNEAFVTQSVFDFFDTKTVKISRFEKNPVDFRKLRLRFFFLDFFQNLRENMNLTFKNSLGKNSLLDI